MCSCAIFCPMSIDHLPQTLDVPRQPACLPLNLPSPSPPHHPPIHQQDLNLTLFSFTKSVVHRPLRPFPRNARRRVLRRLHALHPNLILDPRRATRSSMVEMLCPSHNPGGQPPMSAAVVDAAEDVNRAMRENGEVLNRVPSVRRLSLFGV